VLGECGGLDPVDSLLGVVGVDATFASNEEALVGLPEPESRRAAMGACVLRQGEETVDGVRGGRRELGLWWAEAAGVPSERKNLVLAIVYAGLIKIGTAVGRTKVCRSGSVERVWRYGSRCR
jgi:hypothetical protein